MEVVTYQFTLDKERECPLCDTSCYECRLSGLEEDEGDCDGDLTDRPSWCRLKIVSGEAAGQLLLSPLSVTPEQLGLSLAAGQFPKG